MTNFIRRFGVPSCIVLLLLLLSLSSASTPAGEFCPFSVYSYEGCYLDYHNNASFVPYNATDPTISPVNAETCACKCGNEGYQYSAIQNLNECYCSNNFNTSATTSTGCINECVGNTTQACGGFEDDTASVLSIYQTTVGCRPACSVNQTCSLFDKSFYMCVPSCEFSADFIYDVPCSDSALVYLNITSSRFFGSNFTYSLDGGATISSNYNKAISFTFLTGVPHSFLIKNRFNCSVTKNITLPTPYVPTQNTAPDITYDASMDFTATYYKLLYPSETGNVQLLKYAVEYRYSCPNSSDYSPWISTNQSDTSLDTVTLPYQYALQYDVRVYSENCVGVSPYSDLSSSVAPSSPYIPTILSAVPQNLVPTTGGSITIAGIYFTDAPTVYVDSVQATTTSVSATLAVFTVGEGQGTHSITVKSHANYSCQEVLSSGFSWSYAPPNVTSTSVLSNAGGSLTITGNSFGLTNANASVTIDAIACGECSVTQKHTTIECTGCPAGSGTDHELLVTVAGLTSSEFTFTYALCDPMCIFGECVANNVCKCDDGHAGNDCSEAHVCAGDVLPGNVCGDCTDSSVCCSFNSVI